VITNLGEYAPGDVVHYKWNSHKADGTPLTFLLHGTPAEVGLMVYRDDEVTEVTGTGTPAPHAGITLTVDHDLRTGMNHVKVDLSADAGYYTTGHTYFVVIDYGSVDGIQVAGTVLFVFRITGRAVNANDIVFGTVVDPPSPTSGSFTAVVDLVPSVVTQWNGRVVIFSRNTLRAALQGQGARILSTGLPGGGQVSVTCQDLTTPPQAGDTFVII
jgi:hypothetical protein